MNDQPQLAVRAFPKYKCLIDSHLMTFGVGQVDVAHGDVVLHKEPLAPCARSNKILEVKDFKMQTSRCYTIL